MTTYTVHTDAFLADEIEADSLDEAIAEGFAGSGIGGIKDEESLHRRFARYVDDGGWCYVERDGERVVEIGECP